MNSNSKTIAAGLLMISCLFSGCIGTDIGVEDSSTTTPADSPSEQHLSDWNVHFAATSNDLPDCNETTNGRLYYVEDAAHFQVCKTSGWEVIDIMGADGKDGLDGANGTDGKDGLDGANGTDGKDGVDANAVLIRAVNGSACPSGGTTFEIGYDLNANGQFDAAEVMGAVDICNGEQGLTGLPGPPGINGTDGSASANTMLTNISTPSPNDCDLGGRIIEHGLDNGEGNGTAQNGILESGEVDYTTTYCSKFARPSVVKDILPGGESSIDGVNWNDNPPVVFDKSLFFQADDGTNGVELWKSDGTEAGTMMVKNINSGSDSSSPEKLTAVGNTLYFVADNGINGSELWMSDGTEAGTMMVKDIRSGSSSSSPDYLTIVGNTLYFAANDGTNGNELWKSDGTSSGTVMVKDIYTGASTNSSNPSQLTAVGSTLFFIGDTGNEIGVGTGAELWKSDGTTTGTVLVMDIATSHDDGGLDHLTAFGNKLAFTADQAIGLDELWISDGTDGFCDTCIGTFEVKQIGDEWGGSGPSQFTVIDNMLYFTANEYYIGGEGRELWKSDGTEAGTVKVKDINNGSGDSNPRELTAVGKTLYFKANDGTHGDELWKSDGTETGTVMVKDIRPGAYGGSPSHLRAIGNTVYFQALWGYEQGLGTGGLELWWSDGTTNGTKSMKLSADNNDESSPWMFYHIGNTLLFTAGHSSKGGELWSVEVDSLGEPVIIEMEIILS